MIALRKPTSSSLRNGLVRSMIGVLVIGIVIFAALVCHVRRSRGVATDQIILRSGFVGLRLDNIAPSELSTMNAIKRRVLRKTRDALGAGTFHKWFAPFCDVTSIRFDGVPLVVTDWAAISEFPELRSLELRGCSIQTGALAAMEEFNSLEFLDLSGTNISDDDLEPLATLPKLRGLSLAHTRIHGSLFRYDWNWKSTKSLTVLDVSGTDIQWYDLEAMTKFEVLERLDVSECDLRVAEFQARMTSYGDPVEIPVFPKLEILLYSENAFGPLKNEFLSRQPSLQIVR